MYTVLICDDQPDIVNALKIYLGAESEDTIEIGENWLPKQSTTSLKDIEAVYGQERRAS